MGWSSEPGGAGASGDMDGDGGAAWAGHVEVHRLGAMFGHGGPVGRVPQRTAIRWFHRMRQSGMITEWFQDGRTYWVPDAEVEALKERMRLRTLRAVDPPTA